MSCVHLIAASKELPLCDRQVFRGHTRGKFAVGLTGGFKVEPLEYYRRAVDALGYPMLPFRYECALENVEDDLMNLRAYLEANFSPGEILELWSVWLSGDADKKCPPRFRGRLDDFDREALKQFLDTREKCFTITV